MARKIHTNEHTGNKVYWSYDDQEYYVVFSGTDKSHPATYYTDDKQDALDTAAHSVKQITSDCIVTKKD